jgi:hypothetical protein
MLANRLTGGRIAAGLTAALMLSGGLPRVAAQEESAVLLVLDKDALDYGPPPHLIPLDGVDSLNAKVGLRDELPYFSGHVDQVVILPGARNGSPGWFALRSVPSAWASEHGGTDGLTNFAVAGPGLGSPDESGDRESLLRDVPDVTSLRASGLSQLSGKRVCAIVYATDIVVEPGAGTASLKGDTFGVIAFQVLTTLPSGDDMFPHIQVQVLDGHEACAGNLVAFPEAPTDGS